VAYYSKDLGVEARRDQTRVACGVYGGSSRECAEPARLGRRRREEVAEDGEGRSKMVDGV
jgi:hypothetical protein